MVAVGVGCVCIRVRINQRDVMLGKLDVLMVGAFPQVIGCVAGARATARNR